MRFTYSRTLCCIVKLIDCHRMFKPKNSAESEYICMINKFASRLIQKMKALRTILCNNMISLKIMCLSLSLCESANISVILFIYARHRVHIICILRAMFACRAETSTIFESINYRCRRMDGV